MRKVLPFNQFPHRLFSVVAVFALIAFLLTLKPVVELVKAGTEAIGVNFPPVEIFQNVAANMLLVGLGTLGILIAGIILVPIVKIAVTLISVAVVAVGLFNIYKTFTKKPTQNILPEAIISKK